MSEALGLPAQPELDGTPGALLKRERERRALSVQQAAEDLHLDPWVIEAIEANRFQALGAPVYAKGHLRKYGTRLDLPVEELIQKYEALQDRPIAADPIPTAIAAPLPPPRRSFKGPILIVVSLLVVAALAWAAFELFVARPKVGPTNSSASAGATALAPNNVVPPTATPVEAAAPAAVPGSTASNPVEPSVSAGQVPTAEPAAQQILSDAKPIEVRLQFSGDSWTEIYDAQGARLMFAMGTEGRTQTLTGVPPLQVRLGSVSAVSLEVNGEPVAIPRQEGRESSRFVIEPSGNLR